VADLILEIAEGEHAGWQVPLDGPVEAGRDRDATLPLADNQVSRRHLRVTPRGQGAWVEDLGSTNGTYVNDQPLHGPRELRVGDRVRIGLTVLELRTTVQAAQPYTPQQGPPVTELGRGVLVPVAEEQLPAAEPAPNAPSFLTEETEPAFLPRDAEDDEDARSDYAALAALVDTRVKHQTTVASFAFLAVAGLAVLIFFGAR
jgi:predicted component of type VI protein secretion system